MAYFLSIIGVDESGKERKYNLLSESQDINNIKSLLSLHNINVEIVREVGENILHDPSSMKQSNVL